jgi:hypothetical protein
MITMFDDINISLMPKEAEAVAGYVNGHWPTYNQVVQQWPKAKHLSIAVSSNADADCLDVERGDATNAVAPAWVHRQLRRGLKRPVVYTSISNALPLLQALQESGIERDQVRLWTAHYTHREHICGPQCGYGPVFADGTQWTSQARMRSLDQSLLHDDFFAPRPRGTILPNPTKPKTVPYWWYQWAGWRLTGRKEQRPSIAPRVIPMWAWIMLYNWQIRHR